jgi:hypothetical protein
VGSWASWPRTAVCWPCGRHPIIDQGVDQKRCDFHM